MAGQSGVDSHRLNGAARPLKTIDFRMLNSISRKIDATARFVERDVKQPVVLILHGFKGFKDWGFFPYVAEQIAGWGAISISMNFSLNGISLNSDVFERLDDFANNTISREVADACEVVEALATGMLNAELPLAEHWNRQIFILGHSRGGGVALLTARRFDEHIQKACLWNSVGRWGRYTERQENLWRDKGYFEITNQRTKQVLRMNLSYLEDIEQNSEQLDLSTAIAECRSDVLLVHAEQDLAVPIGAAEKLLAAAEARASSERKVEMIRIPKSGHTFGAVHPFNGSTNSLEDALLATRKFLGL